MTALYSITVRSVAPQTTLWGGPGPSIEPGTDDLVARTLTTRPPDLLIPVIFLYTRGAVDFPGSRIVIFEQLHWEFLILI